MPLHQLNESPNHSLSYTNMRSSTLFVTLLGTAISFANGATHTVLVGDEGLTFTPSTTTAAIGDTVTFVFVRPTCLHSLALIALTRYSGPPA